SLHAIFLTLGTFTMTETNHNVLPFQSRYQKDIEEIKNEVRMLEAAGHFSEYPHSTTEAKLLPMNPNRGEPQA
ncbi:hypothetical protein OFN56_28630, partial [Escherichia coli]|nr:hypothetical protein [Escherichia coli]